VNTSVATYSRGASEYLAVEGQNQLELLTESS